MIEDDMVFPEMMMTPAGWNAIADRYEVEDRPASGHLIAMFGLTALIAGIAICMRINR